MEHFGVQVALAVALQREEGVIGWNRVPVRAARCHGHESIGRAKYAPPDRNLVGGSTSGISRSIPVFVMIFHELQHRAKEDEWGEDLEAGPDVVLDEFIFVAGQRSWFVQNCFPKGQASDVVDASRGGYPVTSVRW